MTEYPRALRTAHHVVYFHSGDARAFVAGQIAAAVRKGDQTSVAEWRKVAHFVERLLVDTSEPIQPAHLPRARRSPSRYRGGRPRTAS